MGCLAWLVAMAGVGAASLAFAVAAPSPARWVLASIVAALLAGPHLLQWWLRRARRTEVTAARWWAAGPDPAEVAFLCGGPGRVVDLVVFDLVTEGRLTVDEEGGLAWTGATPPDVDDRPADTEPGATPADVNDRPADTEPGAAPADVNDRPPETRPDATPADADGQPAGTGPGAAPDAVFGREIFDRLSHGPTDLAALRFSVRSSAAVASLWRAAARQGLLLPVRRREFTHWYVAGAVVAVGYFVAVALGGRQTFWVGTASLALGVLALWRVRFLVGYGFDPRTAAGLRAAELARAATRPGDRRHRIAVSGLHSASDLRPGARDRHPVPPSRWHLPWYARPISWP